jgi:hypothetical protein
MANIKLHSDSPVSATSVSNTFIDEYMSDANGEFVKIYLYLLRLMNAPQASFSISSIADKFEHTEKDVKRALAYWERMHLLQLEYDNDKNLTGIRMLDSSSRDAAPSDPGTSGTQTEPAGTERPCFRRFGRNTGTGADSSFQKELFRGRYFEFPPE